MLCVEPSDRLSVHDVKYHRWIHENRVDMGRAVGQTLFSRQYKALKNEYDRSNIDDYGRALADSQCSDQDGSECDEPGQRAIHRQDSLDRFSQDVDQDHDGRSKFFGSDDEGEYESLATRVAKRLIYENDELKVEKYALSRAMSERLISENDALKAALASTSKNEGLKDLDESKEAIKQGKTATMFQFENLGWGLLKNFLFKSETN